MQLFIFQCPGMVLPQVGAWVPNSRKYSRTHVHVLTYTYSRTVHVYTVLHVSCYCFTCLITVLHVSYYCFTRVLLLFYTCPVTVLHVSDLFSVFTLLGALIGALTYGLLGSHLSSLTKPKICFQHKQ